MKNKRGWIRIIEAFAAILIIAGVVILIVGNISIKKQDTSSAITDSESAILNAIQLNDTLRAEVLSTSGEVIWNNFYMEAPKTQSYINSHILNYLDCAAQICDQGSTCLLNSNQNVDIYAEEVTITSTLSEFNPRILKLFCWQK